MKLRLALRTKEFLAFLLAGILPLVGFGWVGYQENLRTLQTVEKRERDTFYQQTSNHLSFVRDIRKSQTLSYFQNVERSLRSIQENPLTLAAAQDLINAFEEVNGVDQGEALLQQEEYSKTHEKFHKVFKYLIQRSDLNNFFLFNAHGELTYTVIKNSDFSTNFISGPYASSSLGKTFQKAMLGSLGVSDFSPYAPFGNQVAAFMAIPLRDQQSHIIGVIAVQIPVEPLTRLVQESAGLGKTERIYLVGPDFRLRSNLSDLTVSKSFQENHELKTLSVTEGLSGKTGSHQTKNTQQQSVLSAYVPLDFYSLHWVLVTEINQSEVEQAAHLLIQSQQQDLVSAKQIYLLWINGFLLMSLLLGLLFFRWISVGVRKTTQEIETSEQEIAEAGDFLVSSTQAQKQSLLDGEEFLETLIASTQDASSDVESVSHAVYGSLEQTVLARATLQNALTATQKINEFSIKIMTSMDEIADVTEQTHLMAINASIEAARIGEQGKGFSTVAEDIRKLADRNAKAMRSMTRLMHQTTLHIHENAELSHQIGQQFGSISIQIEQIVELMRQISATTKTQVSAAEILKDRMQNALELLEENTFSVEKLISASRQVWGNVQELVRGRIQPGTVLGQEKQETYIDLLPEEITISPTPPSRPRLPEKTSTLKKSNLDG